VWSKVIAAAIIAGFGWLTYRLNWWPGWMTREIARVWAYLLSPLSISHWLFGLFVFLSALVVLGVLYLVAVVLFQKEKAQSPPSWASYTEDVFDGLRWRWRYQGTYIDIDSLAPYCPICDLRLVPIIGPSFVNKIWFKCEKCQEERGTYEGSLNSLQGQVIRLIDQKIRIKMAQN
jgi:hypothetical protein